MTKPSRFLSKGEEAFSGTSLREERAFIEQNPANESGVIPDSLPPAMATSIIPALMPRNASPSEWDADAHALTTQKFGPLKPYFIDTRPAAMSVIIMGTRNGDTRPGPRESNLACSISRVFRPPIPEPMIVPMRARSSVLRSSPESLITCSAAKSAKSMFRSVRLISLGSTTPEKSMSFISPAIFEG